MATTNTNAPFDFRTFKKTVEVIPPPSAAPGGNTELPFNDMFDSMKDEGCKGQNPVMLIPVSFVAARIQAGSKTKADHGTTRSKIQSAFLAWTKKQNDTVKGCGLTMTYVYDDGKSKESFTNEPYVAFYMRAAHPIKV